MSTLAERLASGSIVVGSLGTPQLHYLTDCSTGSPVVVSMSGIAGDCALSAEPLLAP